MEVSELLLQGVRLMVLGMGTVFVFLAVLVVAVKQSSRLVQWYERNYVPVEQAPAQPQVATPPSATTDDTLLAVISSAIHRYRSS
ncbi:MAG: OadG family protein [Magnetococcales bacterium]|nr:OadG family protein [Magnetococcales bacterium]